VSKMLYCTVLINSYGTDRDIALCPTQLGIDEPRLSGVGLFPDAGNDLFTVPSLFHVRWDDEALSHSEKLRLTQRSENNICGYAFILHLSCSTLLQEFFGPKPIPVARLVEVFKSCPIQSNCCGMGLNWGHDYGGCIPLDNLHPWEEKDFDNSSSFDNEGQYQYVKADPWTVLNLSKLIQRASVANQSNPNLKILGLKQRKLLDKKTADDSMIPNCLTNLPVEILGIIMEYIPTPDVKSLAQASTGLKIIVPSRLGQSFWASRFAFASEFEFVFEARKHRGNLDWRWLYFEIVKILRHDQGLKNRRRVWRILQSSSLLELLSLRWSGDQTLLPVNQNANELRWKTVHGSLLQRTDFATRCQTTYTQQTLIPTFLRQVTISYILVGDTTYITGVSFISNEGQRVCVGYTAKGKSSLNLIDQAIDISMASIQGFILAVGSKGIHALQLVTSKDQTSQWFGCPKGLPKTLRLVTSTPITALEAGFDVSYTFYLFLLLD
jgi:hypothetical protein